jgi:Tfp pilus assembly protein PilN
MIRINLIGDEAPSRRCAARIAASIGLRTAEAAIVLATVGAIGWSSWSLHERSVRVDREIASADATDDSASASQEVQVLESRRADLQQRIAAIERLGRQPAIIRALEGLDATVPANVWLLELSQKNSDLTVKGLAATLADVSRLANEFRASGLFSGVVEIIDTEKTSHSSGRELVRFSVRGTVGN